MVQITWTPFGRLARLKARSSQLNQGYRTSLVRKKGCKARESNKHERCNEDVREGSIVESEVRCAVRQLQVGV